MDCTAGPRAVSRSGSITLLGRDDERHQSHLTNADVGPELHAEEHLQHGTDDVIERPIAKQDTDDVSHGDVALDAMDRNESEAMSAPPATVFANLNTTSPVSERCSR